MFQVGENVVYGNMGICRVGSVGTINMGNMAKDRLYYTLIPVFNAGSKVFVPVDSDKAIMRHALTKEQIMELLNSLLDIEPLWITDEKKREQEYKDAVNSCDCKRLFQIIKTIHFRKKKRLDDGKKVTSVDERYFQIVEDKLYGELAVALEIGRDKVEEYIKVFIEKNQK